MVMLEFIPLIKYPDGAALSEIIAHVRVLAETVAKFRHQFSRSGTCGRFAGMAAFGLVAFQWGGDLSRPEGESAAADRGVVKQVPFSAVSVLGSSVRRSVLAFPLIATAVMLGFVILMCFGKLYSKRASERNRRLSDNGQSSLGNWFVESENGSCAGEARTVEEEDDESLSSQPPTFPSGRERPHGSGSVAILIPDESNSQRLLGGSYSEGLACVVIAVIVIIIISAIREALASQPLDL